MQFRSRDSSCVLDTDAKLKPAPSLFHLLQQMSGTQCIPVNACKELNQETSMLSFRATQVTSRPYDRENCCNAPATQQVTIMRNIKVNQVQRRQKLMMDIELWLIFTNREGKGETKGRIMGHLKIHQCTARGKHRWRECKRKTKMESKKRRNIKENPRRKTSFHSRRRLFLLLTLLQSHSECGSQWSCSTGKCS